MTGTAGQTRPDTHEMVIVHRAFRREFRLAPDLIRGVAAGDTGRAGIVADHVSDLIWGLHHHHRGEDELLWPKLLDRAAPRRELIELMEVQHRRISEGLDGLQPLIGPWRDTGAVPAGSALATALDDLRAALVEHLDQEEAEILPLAAEHLSVAEWNELGESAVKSLPKNKRLIFLGMVLEDTSDEEQAAMIANLPPPVRVLWRVFGARGYARYVAKVRG